MNGQELGTVLVLQWIVSGYPLKKVTGRNLHMNIYVMGNERDIIQHSLPPQSSKDMPFRLGLLRTHLSSSV